MPLTLVTKEKDDKRQRKPHKDNKNPKPNLSLKKLTEQIIDKKRKK